MKYQIAIGHDPACDQSEQRMLETPVVVTPEATTTTNMSSMSELFELLDKLQSSRLDDQGRKLVSCSQSQELCLRAKYSCV